MTVVYIDKWALEKLLNRSRCHLGWRLWWAQGTMY